MRIVNTQPRVIALNFRTGEQVPIDPAPGYVIRPDSDIDFLDDSAVSLSLFSTGLLLLRNTDGSAWTGPALPSTPNPGPPSGVRQLAADYTLGPIDDGFELRFSAAAVLTVPSGILVPPTVIVKAPATGDVTVRRGGTATLNGGTADLTRTRAANPAGFAITPNIEADAYGVTGA